MALSGVLGTLFLFALLHAVFTHPKVLFCHVFIYNTLACLLYLAGGVAGFSLFSLCTVARRFLFDCSFDYDCDNRAICCIQVTFMGV